MSIIHGSNYQISKMIGNEEYSVSDRYTKSVDFQKLTNGQIAFKTNESYFSETGHSVELISSPSSCLVSEYCIEFFKDTNKFEISIEINSDEGKAKLDEFAKKHNFKHTDEELRISYEAIDYDDMQTTVNCHLDSMFLSKNARNDITKFFKRSKADLEATREVKQDKDLETDVVTFEEAFTIAEKIDQPIEEAVTQAEEINQAVMEREVKEPEIIELEGNKLTAASILKFRLGKLTHEFIAQEEVRSIIENFSKKTGIPEEKCILLRYSQDHWDFVLSNTKNSYVLDNEFPSDFLAILKNNPHIITPVEAKSPKPSVSVPKIISVTEPIQGTFPLFATKKSLKKPVKPVNQIELSSKGELTQASLEKLQKMSLGMLPTDQSKYIMNKFAKNNGCSLNKCILVRFSAHNKQLVIHSGNSYYFLSSTIDPQLQLALKNNPWFIKPEDLKDLELSK